MDDWFGLQRGLVAVGLLAAVPGCADDKDKATESTGTDPGSTGASDGTGTGTTGGTTGDPPTGTGSGSATDSGTGTTGEPTTGGTSTTDTTTGTSTTDTTTGGIDIPPVCQSYGAKVAECYNPRYGMEAAAGCAYGIQEYGMIYGPNCVAAYEDFYACLSALSCAEFTGTDPVCLPESMKIEPACQ